MRTTSHPTRIVLRTLVDSGIKKKTTRTLDSSLLMCPGCVFIINRYDEQTVRCDVRQFPSCFCIDTLLIHSNWSALGDEQMSTGYQFSLPNDRQRVATRSQPDKFQDPG